MARLTVNEAREVAFSCGLTPLDVLGSGMEGMVFVLDADHVAKVWFGRDAADLTRLKQFHEAAAAGGGLRVSRIDQVLDAPRGIVSIESRIHGGSLKGVHGGQVPISNQTCQLVGDALEGLAAVPYDDALVSLPLLPGEPPAGADRGFTEVLRDTILRRVPPIARPLDDCLDGKLSSVVEHVLDDLQQLTPRRHGLVHGDLIPDNVLISDGAAPGVIDFGFLTTFGDPDFDVALTPAIFDMYGPDAKQLTAELTSALFDRFDTPREVIETYRRAYGLLTAGTFGNGPEDGHFSWCVDLLRSSH